jgi:UDP-glucose 4-epimerase
MQILVTGGAGYIGSFMTKTLLERGNSVVVIDSLERGHKDSVDSRANLCIGNLLNREFISKVFVENKFDAVINFAGYISMEESMKNPYVYFQNNFFSALNVMEEMVKTRTNNFVFSSTAGVYGNPIKLPIPEDHPKNPENPYGESKLMVEKAMIWYQKTHDLNSVALRYFNASGASLDGTLGENHNPESHIIPKIIEAILKKESFKLFGTDYKTKDGTCVRDYIHVLDLVDAHILAIEKMTKDDGMFTYNVGTGNGYSNREIIEMVKQISGENLQTEELARRPGDADALIADVAKIKRELGFNSKYSDLETIVKTAWEWHKKIGLKN